MSFCPVFNALKIATSVQRPEIRAISSRDFRVIPQQIWGDIPRTDEMKPQNLQALADLVFELLD
jgi:hypothetical protein